VAGKRQRADAQGRKLAKALGGKVQPGSGSVWYAKADVKSQRYAIECKYTDKQQYTLKLAEIDKLRREALFEGKQWALHLRLAGRELVIMDAQMLIELEEQYHEKDKDP
jgi:Holliday junction resolvase